MGLSLVTKGDSHYETYHQTKIGTVGKNENFSSFLRFFRIVEPFSILCKSKERFLIDTHSENKRIMFNERHIIFQEIMKKEFLKIENLKIKNN